MAARKAKTFEAPTVVNQVVEIPISQIDPESFQNSRTGEWDTYLTSADGNKVGSAFGELLQSIEEKGQKTPVIVRPKKKGAHGKAVPFELYVGFRRYAAVEAIGAKRGLLPKNTMILAIVKDVTDGDALEENLIENAAREDLSGPDLAWGAYNLIQRRKSEGVVLSGNAVAQLLGKNQSWIAQLLRIVTNGPTIAAAWQQAKAPMNADRIEAITKLKGKTDQETRELQEAEYAKVVKELAENPRGKKGEQRTAVETATRQVERIARILGNLVRQDLIDASGIEWGAKVVEQLGVDPEGLTEAEKAAAGKAGEKAFELAVKPPEPKAKKSKEEKAAEKAAEETAVN